jgi:hypothetical protein
MSIHTASSEQPKANARLIDATAMTSQSPALFTFCAAARLPAQKACATKRLPWWWQIAAEQAASDFRFKSYGYC